MNRQETLDVVQDILDRKVIAPRFSGIMHVDIHCGDGGIRRILVAPEPEKIEYVRSEKST